MEPVGQGALMNQETQLPGARLKAAREQQKLSEKEAAERLHLSMSYLRALEADNYKALPEPTFIKGYLRNYARLLGLSAEELAGAYEAQRQPAIEPLLQSAPEVAASAGQPGAKRKWIWALLVLAGLLLSLWMAVGGQEQAAPRTGMAAPPLPSAPAAPATPEGEADATGETSIALPGAVSDGSLSTPVGQGAPAQPVMVSQMTATVAAPAGTGTQLAAALKAASLEVRLSDSCWLEVVDATGHSLFQGTRGAGARLVLSGVPPFQLTFGNAAAVASVSVDGQQVPSPASAAGEVVKLTAP